MEAGCDTDIEDASTTAYLEMRQQFLITIYGVYGQSLGVYFVGILDIRFSCVPAGANGKRRRAINSDDVIQADYQVAVDPTPEGEAPLNVTSAVSVVEVANNDVAEEGVVVGGVKTFGTAEAVVVVPVSSTTTEEVTTPASAGNLWILPIVSGIVAGLILIGAGAVTISVCLRKQSTKRPTELSNIHRALRFNAKDYATGHSFARSDVSESDSASSSTDNGHAGKWWNRYKAHPGISSRRYF